MTRLFGEVALLPGGHLTVVPALLTCDVLLLGL